jgi:hypothetical protein
MTPIGGTCRLTPQEGSDRKRRPFTRRASSSVETGKDLGGGDLASRARVFVDREMPETALPNGQRGWLAEHALPFYLSGVGLRKVCSFDDAAGGAPRLVVV